MREEIRVWLDDVRPAPEGWTRARTAADVVLCLEQCEVTDLSLDHDLGMCPRCTPGTVVPEANIVVVASAAVVCGWNERGRSYAERSKKCKCGCHITGYDLCVWMAETGRWPRNKPTIHSDNPVGRENMRAVIERYFRKREKI